MKPLFFIVDEGAETRLRSSLESRGAVVKLKRGNDQSPEINEKIWLVCDGEEELFWFGIATEPSGRRILAVAPPQNRKGKELHRLLLDVVRGGGAEQIEKIDGA